MSFGARGHAIEARERAAQVEMERGADQEVVGARGGS